MLKVKVGLRGISARLRPDPSHPSRHATAFHRRSLLLARELRSGLERALPRASTDTLPVEPDRLPPQAHRIDGAPRLTKQAAHRPTIADRLGAAAHSRRSATPARPDGIRGRAGAALASMAVRERAVPITVAGLVLVASVLSVAPAVGTPSSFVASDESPRLVVGGGVLNPPDSVDGAAEGDSHRRLGRGPRRRHESQPSCPGGRPGGGRSRPGRTVSRRRDAAQAGRRRHERARRSRQARDLSGQGGRHPHRYRQQVRHLDDDGLVGQQADRQGLAQGRSAAHHPAGQRAHRDRRRRRDARIRSPSARTATPRRSQRSTSCQTKRSSSVRRSSSRRLAAPRSRRRPRSPRRAAHAAHRRRATARVGVRPAVRRGIPAASSAGRSRAATSASTTTMATGPSTSPPTTARRSRPRLVGQSSSPAGRTTAVAIRSMSATVRACTPPITTCPPSRSIAASQSAAGSRSVGSA